MGHYEQAKETLKYIEVYRDSIGTQTCVIGLVNSLLALCDIIREEGELTRETIRSLEMTVRRFPNG